MCAQYEGEGRGALWSCKEKGVDCIFSRESRETQEVWLCPTSLANNTFNALAYLRGLSDTFEELSALGPSIPKTTNGVPVTLHSPVCSKMFADEKRTVTCTKTRRVNAFTNMEVRPIFGIARKYAILFKTLLVSLSRNESASSIYTFSKKLGKRIRTVVVSVLTGYPVAIAQVELALLNRIFSGSGISWKRTITMLSTRMLLTAGTIAVPTTRMKPGRRYAVMCPVSRSFFFFFDVLHSFSPFTFPFIFYPLVFHCSVSSAIYWRWEHDAESVPSVCFCHQYSQSSLCHY